MNERVLQGYINLYRENFDTNAYSNEDARPLPFGKYKKVVGLIKDELGGKILTEFVTLTAEMYAYKS